MYKEEHPFEKRRSEGEKIRKKYPDRVPVRPGWDPREGGREGGRQAARRSLARPPARSGRAMAAEGGSGEAEPERDALGVQRGGVRPRGETKRPRAFDPLLAPR